ncbi:single-stranded DNA-binding protein [Leptolyngbya sp. 7M]|uniref:single-stranded DNA-binding protein n=1 Tax=Leptolyngbya sp. 7M TaxID=2812896 RepID=UPI001B8D08DB|nr:single-stranded DNA-binding protein [Leptolyngbya sp. 7M]QYO66705.1 single-stranded DNA-binding protein [Leptolyngbya sp. 7M]
MAASISILGNAGSDPELRYSNQGSPIASFSIASNSFKNTPDGKAQITEWFNVTAFGKVAETIAAHVKKGTHLFVLGRLTFNPWIANNGEPRAGAEVILQSFEFAGGNRNGESNATVEAVAQEPNYTDPVNAQPAANGVTPVSTSVAAEEPYVDQF